MPDICLSLKQFIKKTGIASGKELIISKPFYRLDIIEESKENKIYRLYGKSKTTFILDYLLAFSKLKKFNFLQKKLYFHMGF